MSFYHAEWVSRDLLELDKPTKNRIKKFMDKGYFEGHWTEDEPFNPAFVKVKNRCRGDDLVFNPPLGHTPRLIESLTREN